jgi:hypothetical protein
LWQGEQGRLWRGNGVAGHGRAKAARRGGGVDRKGPRGGGGGRVEPACGVEVAKWGAGALAARRSGAQAMFSDRLIEPSRHGTDKVISRD